MLGLTTLRNWLTRTDDDALFGASDEPAIVDRASEDLQLRRWDGAATHRLNAAQFEDVTGRTINEDLVASLPVLMARCSHEATTNPVIQGMIDTHAIDIVGPNGPKWQVLPLDPVKLKASESLREKFAEYALAANNVLKEWFKMPDLCGELSGVDILSLDVRQQWTTGNSVVQVVEDDTIRSRRAIHLRWNPIHSERVFNNRLYGSSNGSRVTLGMERTKEGKRTKYHVLDIDDFGGFSASQKYQAIRSEFIIHRFQSLEPGQICGVPLLASALPTIADIRQFDKLTMEAAKLGAQFGLVFEDKFQDAPQKGPRRAAGVVGAVKTGMAQILHAPKGKEVIQVKPEHPTNNYVEYRSERWRDVGRASQMPLMMIRLGSEDHSFASARFDAMIYQRGIHREQAMIERKYSPSLMDVLREAELAGLIPMRPCQVEIGAIWTRLPHVDPQKEARARQIDLETMSCSLTDVWAEDGMDPPEMVAKLKETVDALDQVQDGLGSAWLLNNMKKSNPAVMDMLDGQQAVSDSKASLAV